LPFGQGFGVFPAPFFSFFFFFHPLYSDRALVQSFFFPVTFRFLLFFSASFSLCCLSPVVFDAYVLPFPSPPLPLSSPHLGNSFFPLIDWRRELGFSLSCGVFFVRRSCAPSSLFHVAAVSDNSSFVSVFLLAISSPRLAAFPRPVPSFFFVFFSLSSQNSSPQQRLFSSSSVFHLRDLFG